MPLIYKKKINNKRKKATNKNKSCNNKRKRATNKRRTYNNMYMYSNGGGVGSSTPQEQSDDSSRTQQPENVSTQQQQIENEIRINNDAMNMLKESIYLLEQIKTASKISENMLKELHGLSLKIINVHNEIRIKNPNLRYDEYMNYVNNNEDFINTINEFNNLYYLYNVNCASVTEKNNEVDNKAAHINAILIEARKSNFFQSNDNLRIAQDEMRKANSDYTILLFSRDTTKGLRDSIKNSYLINVDNARNIINYIKRVQRKIN